MPQIATLTQGNLPGGPYGAPSPWLASTDGREAGRRRRDGAESEGSDQLVKVQLPSRSQCPSMCGQLRSRSHATSDGFTVLVTPGIKIRENKI